MKTWKKMMLTLGLCFLFLGIGVMSAGFAMGGQTSVTMNLGHRPINIGMGGVSTSQKAAVAGRLDQPHLAPFRDLSVDASWVDVTVETGADFGVFLSWIDGDHPLSYTLEGGTLRITDPSSVQIGINLGGQRGKVTVTVPQGTALSKVTLHTDAGDTQVSAIAADSLDIGSSAGKITLENVAAKKLTASLDAGDFAAENVQGEQFSLSSSFGATHLENVRFDRGEINMDAGDLRVENSTIHKGDFHSSFGETVTTNLTSEQLSVSGDAGDIDLHGTLGSVDVGCSMGGVRIQTTRPAGDFSYALQTDVGQIRVDGTKIKGGKATLEGKGPYHIQVQNDAGDVNLSFGA